MSKATGTDSPSLVFIAIGLLASAGGVLATPLVAGPLVLLAFISTVLMLAKGRGTLQSFGQPTTEARNILLIAFGGWFFAELLSTALNNQHWPNLDYPLRFMLGVGVFWIIRYVAIRRTEIFLYGIMTSAAVAVTISSYQNFVLGVGRALGWTNLSIYFGNLSILLCIYAVIILVILRDKVTVPIRWLLTIAIPLLMLAAFLSESRSSWLGLVALFVLIDGRQANRIRLMGGVLAVVAILGAILSLVPELSSGMRITEAFHDVQKIMDGDYRSSIGERLQMWNAALLMFWSAPLVGIGSGQYQAELVNLIIAGMVDMELVNGSTMFNQAHSEIMDVLATKGLVGLIAYVMLLALPFRLFHTLSKTGIAEVKAFAKMGQATTISFLMFGLTLATFKVQIYCAVYPAIIALFAAMALNFGDVNRLATK